MSALVEFLHDSTNSVRHDPDSINSVNQQLHRLPSTEESMEENRKQGERRTSTHELEPSPPPSLSLTGDILPFYGICQLAPALSTG